MTNRATGGASNPPSSPTPSKGSVTAAWSSTDCHANTSIRARNAVRGDSGRAHVPPSRAAASRAIVVAASTATTGAKSPVA